MLVEEGEAMSGVIPAANGGRLLVDVSWLHDHLDDSGLVVVDARPSHAYQAGHIPGAVNLDVYAIRARSSEPEDVAGFEREVEQRLRSIGVRNDSDVIFYEDISGPTAARGVWLMEWLGHERVAMLDGGLRAWVEAGYDVTIAAPEVNPGDFTASPRPDRLASASYILEHLDDPGIAIWDTRNESEHLGANVLARRGGTIPGAIHLEWIESMNPDGTLKAPEALRAQLTAIGLTPDKEIIPFCQSGFRSAHGYFVARLLGYPRVRNYVTSWSEWGNRLDLPVERRR
jgi:thiosulfate/3-mercaptopyruvate sulfurtransferase